MTGTINFTPYTTNMYIYIWHWFHIIAEDIREMQEIYKEHNKAKAPDIVMNNLTIYKLKPTAHNKKWYYPNNTHFSK